MVLRPMTELKLKTVRKAAFTHLQTATLQHNEKESLSEVDVKRQACKGS